MSKAAVDRGVSKALAQFPPNEWHTIAEAADMVRVPPGRMRRWVYGGKVKSVVLPGGRGRRVSGAALNQAMSVEAEPASYVH